MNAGESRVLSDFLERSLRAELPMTRVNRGVMLPGQGAVDQVITTCRYILVLKGALKYTIEGNDFHFARGAHFLIPSWHRRWWSASESGCEIIWCEFDDDPKEIQRGGCFYRQLSMAELNREKRAYLKMLHLWRSMETLSESEKKLRMLQLEGALKGMLANFIPKVERDPRLLMSESRPLHPEVKQALQWLEVHYANPNALEALPRRSALTPNYFRLRFKEALLCTPGEYVKQLRLRHARYLLRETEWQQKRVAMEVGYADPLYFSRIYREFWGRSPSAERMEGANV